MRNITIIDATLPDDKCEYCGKVADLRPYGKNGERICYECGMKPENKETTQAVFRSIINGDFVKKRSAQNN